MEDHERARKAYELWERKNHVPRKRLYEANLVGIRRADGIYLFKNRLSYNVLVTPEGWEKIVKEYLDLGYDPSTVILVPDETQAYN